MDGPPNHFTYNVHDHDKEDEYRFFDRQSSTSQVAPHRLSPTAGFMGDLSTGVPFPLNHRLESVPTTPGPSHPFAIAMGHRYPSYEGQARLSVPRVGSAQHEPPGLSSRSSTTPESRASQILTPEQPSQQSQQKLPEGSEALNLPSANPSATRRRRRKAKEKAKDEEEEEEEEEDDVDVGVEKGAPKRTKFLERNRVAATKCRQKKKEWVQDLEETKLDLESHNTHLQTEYNGLVDQVNQIRSALMDHAHCNDANINQWIENEAKRFVIGTSERYDRMLSTMATIPGHLHRQDSVGSTSGYPSGDSDMLSPNPIPAQSGMVSHPYGAMGPNVPVYWRQDMPSSVATALSQQGFDSGSHETGDEVTYGEMPITDIPYPNHPMS